MKLAEERRTALAARFPRWEPLTLSALADRVTAEYPDRPLIVTGDRELTYSDVQARSRQLASGLIAAGLAPGEHVALIMANYPEYAVAKLAIARAGAVCIPVNFLLRGRELGYVLGQSEAAMLITMDSFRGHDYLADLAAMASDLPRLRETFAFDTATAGDAAGLEQLAARATVGSDAELARREAASDGHALSDIIYTSGTTGRSKGVMLTHDMILRAAYSSALTRSFEDRRRIQFAMPMYHVFGYVECFVAAMIVAGSFVPHVLFDPDEMLDWAERLQSNDIVSVPMMTHRLLDRARVRGFHAPALRAYFNSGGVNVPTIWNDIHDVFGVREIHTGYGMTETTASAVCTHTEDDESWFLRSNGRIKLAGVAGDPALGGRIAEYRAVDPQTGEAMPDGESGELQVRGPVVTRGYFNKPEETAEAFTTDAWLRTGDIGHLTEGGWLTLTGRIKESYRCGGEMVMPREIEELFDNHPGIAQALVVGVPDPKMGEVGCLCLVPESAARLETETLIRFCAERLARFKVPKHVLWLAAEEIPMTVTGRPQKFLLAKIAADRVKETAG